MGRMATTVRTIAVIANTESHVTMYTENARMAVSLVTMAVNVTPVSPLAVSIGCLFSF